MSNSVLGCDHAGGEEERGQSGPVCKGNFSLFFSIANPKRSNIMSQATKNPEIGLKFMRLLKIINPGFILLAFCLAELSRFMFPGISLQPGGPEMHLFLKWKLRFSCDYRTPGTGALRQTQKMARHTIKSQD